MRTTAKLQSGLVFDRARAQAEWLRGVPESVRRAFLPPRDLARLLDWTEQFITRETPEALAELQTATYRLASRLELDLGHAAALRYLRDGLARALAYSIDPGPEATQVAARIISHISDAIWEAHANHLQETIQRQQDDRLQHELTLAKRIQERLLPRTVPRIPGFDIAGRVLPAAEVGGDYWSCKNYPEDDIVTFKLADITGHGIAAATLVAAVKFISGGYYRAAKTAAQVMERTNNVLVRETPNEIMVTMVYGWLLPHSHEMSVVNAGHSPVLHLTGGKLHRIPTTGVALGMIETRYTEVRIRMAPGDVFFTCSDGVTEPVADQALGEAWVQEQLLRHAHLPAEELVQAVLDEALREYRAPKDDMSVLVIKRNE